MLLVLAGFNRSGFGAEVLLGDVESHFVSEPLAAEFLAVFFLSNFLFSSLVLSSRV